MLTIVTETTYTKTIPKVRPAELRVLIRTAANTLCVPERLSPEGTLMTVPMLQALRHLQAFSAAPNYAQPGANEDGGELPMSASASAPDISAHILEAEITKRCELEVSGLGVESTRTSDRILAWADWLIKHGQESMLREAAGILSAWCVQIEKLAGNGDEPLWGWPCPGCGAHYLPGDLEGMAPMSGSAVIKGAYVHWCTQCSWIMRHDLADRRAATNLNQAAGSARLATLWRGEARKAGYRMMTNAFDVETAERSAKRYVQAHHDLNSGLFMWKHANAEERAKNTETVAVQELPEAA